MGLSSIVQQALHAYRLFYSSFFVFPKFFFHIDLDYQSDLLYSVVVLLVSVFDIDNKRGSFAVENLSTY